MTRELFEKYNDGQRDGSEKIKSLAASLIAERVKELDAAMPSVVMSDDDAVLLDRILDEKSFLKSFSSKLDQYY